MSSELIRDAERVKKAVKNVGESLIAVEQCKILVPEYYFSNNLGTYEAKIHTVGIFALVVEDKYYSVSRVNAFIHTAPSKVNTVMYGSDKFYEFHYFPGDAVIVNRMLVKVSTLVYRIYNAFITNGKIPWFFSYDDLCKLFHTALSHGDANIRADYALLEVLASLVTRSREDKFTYFRHLRIKDTPKNRVFVPLKSVTLGTTNTTAKLLGNYFNEGMTSALAMPSTRNETIENIIRGDVT